MTKCPVCGAEPRRLLADHCHAHGRPRGPVCHGCNCAMMWIDRGMVPATYCTPSRLSALAGHAARCPECPPVETGKLTLARYQKPGRTKETIRITLDLPMIDAIHAYAGQRGLTLAAAATVLLSGALLEEGTP